MTQKARSERADSSPKPALVANLAVRERYRDEYWRKHDPIIDDRLLWRAQSFRHTVHLLPGERILVLGCGELSMEMYTTLRLFYLRQRPESIVFGPATVAGYRLFAHDDTWRDWEKAADQIRATAPLKAVISTTAPHF